MVQCRGRLGGSGIRHAVRCPIESKDNDGGLMRAVKGPVEGRRMKKSKIETAETRRRIVKAAAAEFRRKETHAPGLCELMAAAGLTHGGFYRHFDSKDQLIAEACAAGME